MAGYADELSVKLTARDEMSAKLQGVRKELKSTEREWAAARKTFAETGTAEAAADVKRLEQRWRELARAQKEASTSLAAAKRDVAQLSDEATKSGRVIDRVRGNIVKYQKEIRNTGLVMGAAFAYFAKTSLTHFSSVEDAASALQATFGQTGAAMIAWAKQNGDAYNVSQEEALNALQTYAGYAKSAGLQQAQLAAFSQDLVARSADAASYYGGTTAAAIEAFGAALRGEAEPARRYGVFVDDLSLKAEYFNLTGQKVTGTLTAQQKILAAHSLIMKQTGVVIGDVARTQDSTANALKDASQQWSDLQASMGTIVAKVAGPVLRVFGQVVNVVGALPEPVRATVLVVTALGIAAMIATPRIISLAASIKQAELSGAKFKGGLKSAAGFVASGWGIALAAGGVALGYFLDQMGQSNARIEEFGNNVDSVTGKLNDAGIARVVDQLTRDISPEDWKQLDALGFGVTTVTRAITGGAPAWDAFRESVAGARAAMDPMDGRRGLLSTMQDNAHALSVEVDRGQKNWAIAADVAADLGLNVDKAGDAAATAGGKFTSAAKATDRLKAAQKGLAGALSRADAILARHDAKRGVQEALKAYRKKPTQESGDAVSQAILAAADTYKKPAAKAAYLKGAYTDFASTVSSSNIDASLKAKITSPLADAYAEAKKLLSTIDQIDKSNWRTAVGRLRIPAKERADGGAVFGPGTSTSDSIPAWLSNGEYVIRANAARAIGYGTLDKLNRADRLGLGRLPAAVDAPPIRLPGVPVVRDAPLVGHLTVEAHDQVDVDLALVRLSRQQERDRRTRMAGTR